MHNLQEAKDWVNDSENKYIKAARLSWHKDHIKRLKAFNKKHNI